MPKFVYQAKVTVTIERDVRPDIDSVRKLLEECTLIDIATEDGENISDTGGVVQSVNLDWNTLHYNVKVL